MVDETACACASPWRSGCTPHIQSVRYEDTRTKSERRQILQKFEKEVPPCIACAASSVAKIIVVFIGEGSAGGLKERLLNTLFFQNVGKQLLPV